VSTRWLRSLRCAALAVLVVATPVSAAVDLVTLPIQVVVLLVKWPRC